MGSASVSEEEDGEGGKKTATDARRPNRAGLPKRNKRKKEKTREREREQITILSKGNWLGAMRRKQERQRACAMRTRDFSRFKDGDKARKKGTVNRETYHFPNLSSVCNLSWSTCTHPKGSYLFPPLRIALIARHKYPHSFHVHALLFL